MKARNNKNDAFFAKKEPYQSKLSNGVSRLLRLARESGSINLNSQNLNEIPLEVFLIDETLQSDEKFWEICPLTKADFSFNNINCISPEISKLSDLCSLKLRNNKLSTVPDEVYGLPLKHLDINSNILSGISPAFGRLEYLKEALLSSNRITCLPAEISCCVQLQILELNDNLLVSLPQELGLLRELVKLSLSNNKLTELPQCIGNLRKLQLLECRRNNLRQLFDMNNLDSLNFMDVGENKITQVIILILYIKLTLNNNFNILFLCYTLFLIISFLFYRCPVTLAGYI